MSKRSIVLRSSRTLPGQSSCASRSTASGAIGARRDAFAAREHVRRSARRAAECPRAARAAAARGSARRSGDRTDPRGSAPRRSPPRGSCSSPRARARRPAIGFAPPMRVTTPSCSTRSTFACAARLMSPTSSRKSVPPCACSNLPGAIGDGAGERALHVAEQLALDQLARNRRAVHFDERLRRRASTACGSRARRAPCPCRSRR